MTLRCYGITGVDDRIIDTQSKGIIFNQLNMIAFKALAKEREKKVENTIKRRPNE